MSRRRIWFGFLLFAVLAGVAFKGLRPREPLYQGKSLRAWLEDAAKAGPTAAADTNDLAAIRQFGASAVPTLMDLLRCEDSPLKRDCIKLVRRQSLIPTHFHTDQEYHFMACIGFYALGPAAREAVPELVQLLNAKKPGDQGVVADALGNIGPDAEAAVPSLLRSINDPDRIVRWDTTLNLSKIHGRPDLAVPVLITNLTPTNTIMFMTIDALGAFGESARAAVPRLRMLLTNEDAMVRFSASYALKKIGGGGGG